MTHKEFSKQVTRMANKLCKDYKRCGCVVYRRVKDDTYKRTNIKGDEKA